MQNYDVIVVGAGPGGSAAARKCMNGGLKTLLIDKCRLPRRKACSGIITNASQNYVLENFGPVPEGVFGRPYASRGMAMYFPSAGPVYLDFDCYSLYIWRDRFDLFLAEASGAELQDETRFVRLEEEADGLKVFLQQKGQAVTCRTKYLIGADGSFSRVIHSFAPDVYDGLPFGFACQKYYEGAIDADDRYLYWFLLKGISPFPWLNLKDGQIIIGLANVVGLPFNPPFQSFLEYLRANLGLKIKRELATEGCRVNLMTPLNRFFPGRGRVLLVGDAMGLMHQGGEGISCALASGGYAGEALLRGMDEGKDPLPLYRKLVRPEMVTALDQFNPFRMKESAPSGSYRQPEMLPGFNRLEKIRLLREAISFVRSEFDVPGLLPAVLKNCARRTILRRYNIGVLE